ncbi:hypothetical protein D3C84_964240 [compost metagenome]
MIQVKRIDTQIRTFHDAELDQAVDNRTRVVDRNREADAFDAEVGNLHTVNAHDIAVKINKRTAAVALINGSINLDHFLLPVVIAVLIDRYRNDTRRLADNAHRQ